MDSFEIYARLRTALQDTSGAAPVSLLSLFSSYWGWGGDWLRVDQGPGSVLELDCSEVSDRV